MTYFFIALSVVIISISGPILYAVIQAKLENKFYSNPFMPSFIFSVYDAIFNFEGLMSLRIGDRQNKVIDKILQCNLISYTEIKNIITNVPTILSRTTGIKICCYPQHSKEIDSITFYLLNEELKKILIIHKDSFDEQKIHCKVLKKVKTFKSTIVENNTKIIYYPSFDDVYLCCPNEQRPILIITREDNVLRLSQKWEEEESRFRLNPLIPHPSLSIIDTICRIGIIGINLGDSIEYVKYRTKYLGLLSDETTDLHYQTKIVGLRGLDYKICNDIFVKRICIFLKDNEVSCLSIVIHENTNPSEICKVLNNRLSETFLKNAYERVIVYKWRLSRHIKYTFDQVNQYIIIGNLADSIS